MEKYIQRKRKNGKVDNGIAAKAIACSDQAETTDFKLGLLASICGNAFQDQELLLETLLACGGNVDDAASVLVPGGANERSLSPRKRMAVCRGVGYQSSLPLYKDSSSGGAVSQSLTRRGKTLHLYSPSDVAVHTPCSMIHNFLPSGTADKLLRELLAESTSFKRDTFKLFDNVVSSPHTSCFYVHELDLQGAHKDYFYNGSQVDDLRKSTTEMLSVSALVEEVVNQEVAKRITSHYPNAKKLRYQSPKRWTPNSAFVNCYDGARESVGYHSDQLTYLGPRAIIASLSLGVTREFRVRRILGKDKEVDASDKRAVEEENERVDQQGQIAIHLPHNSLLVMHAEMQEEWKHSIAPAKAIDPHPLAGQKRLNITYRHYRESFAPSLIPKCKCNISAILRVVQKQGPNRGKYMWMCHTNYVPDRQGCSFFQWAEFDGDGEPVHQASPAMADIHS